MKVDIPAHLLAPLTIDASLSDYKLRIQNFTDWSFNQFNQVPVGHLVNARSQFVDFLLGHLWQKTKLNDESNLSLIAVGGYGRGELHPYSDIDLLIISDKDLSENQKDKVSQLVTLLWDLKFEVGQAVRTIKETLSQAKSDTTIATNLMERRLLCGSVELFETLGSQLAKDNFISSKEFYLAKREEQTQRHNSYHSTSYNLEPNLKANPGCLRDLQTISWVAKKHFHTQDIEDLVTNDYLLMEEFQEMEECQDYLWQMRFALHLVAKRSENRLLFDHQAAVAELMGFGDDGKAAVERMMKRFFRVARRIIELNTMLLQRFNSAILGITRDVVFIDDDFAIHGRSLLVRHDDVFFYRANIIKMFTHIAEHPQIEKLHSRTIRLLRKVRRRLMGDLHDIEKCREAFLEFVRHPRAMGKPFTMMLKHSVLAYYMPNWRHIVGQMQFDLFHAYTVDEHTHRLMKNLYRFSKAEYANEFPLCSEIMKKLDHKEVLYLAGLFHDIGKGRGGDHSELGAVDAEQFSKMHKLPASDNKLISWLVKNHLLMSVTAQKSDIYDPDVISEFAKKVKNEKHLDHLYCLTVADIRATNSNLWNDWKNSLLADLYLLTKRAIRQGVENAKDMRETALDHKQQVQHELIKQGFAEDSIIKVWKQFRTLYFARHTPRMIQWHSEYLLTHKNRSKEPLVLVSDQPVRGGTQVFVYTKDQPGLLADIVAAFEYKQVNVVDAHIMNTKDKYVVDTFIILEQDNSEITSADRRIELQSLIKDVIINKTSMPTTQRRLPRKLKQFSIPVTVQFMPEKNKRRDLFELNALDTPGLLARITKVFKEQKIMLHSAKISTIGEKAQDIFKISTLEGEKLTELEQETLVDALKAEINPTEN